MTVRRSTSAVSGLLQAMSAPFYMMGEDEINYLDKPEERPKYNHLGEQLWHSTVDLAAGLHDIIWRPIAERNQWPVWQRPEQPETLKSHFGTDKDELEAKSTRAQRNPGHEVTKPQRESFLIAAETALFELFQKPEFSSLSDEEKSKVVEKVTKYMQLSKSGVGMTLAEQAAQEAAKAKGNNTGKIEVSEAQASQWLAGRIAQDLNIPLVIASSVEAQPTVAQGATV